MEGIHTLVKIYQILYQSKLYGKEEGPFKEPIIDHKLPEMRLNLHFSPQLVLHPGLLQLVLEEHLQGQDEFSLPLSCQVDVAKLPLSQRTANVKILQAPWLPVRAQRCTGTTTLIRAVTLEDKV